MIVTPALFAEAETVAAETAAAAGQASSYTAPTIKFPNLGISITEMSDGFNVFGIHIAWYGVIIAIGIVLACIIVYGLAKRTGQNPDDYIDIFIATVVFGIIGARLYYVVFSWDYYAANPAEIINLRNGGLAIYGGIIFGVLTMIVMSRIKKMNILRILDTCAPGVVIAQAIGRWGNFVNREAFGGYTDTLFAMQIKQADARGVINSDLAQHILTNNGEHYIQVHPTFFYESMWCLLVFILIMIFRKKAKYYGEVALWYFGGYALGRAFIEGLRTDSLYIGHSNIAVSQLLAVLIFVASLAILIMMRIFMNKEPEKYAYVNLTVPGWKDLKFEKKKKADKSPEKEAEASEAAQSGAEEDQTEEASGEPLPEQNDSEGAETVEEASGETEKGQADPDPQEAEVAEEEK